MRQLLRSYMRQIPGQKEDAKTRAVRTYAPMVYRVVRQVAERMPPSVDREYLFSAGMVGLLDALAKYDEARGIPFEAYARIRIKGAVLDELRSLDHLTRTMRKVSRSVVALHQDMERAEGQPVSDDDLARRAGMSIGEVHESRARRAPPEAIDPTTLDALDLATLWQSSTSPLAGMEWEERVRLVSQALAELPERNRLVVGLYYEAELTLQEIGDVLGVTQSRVSQILRKTMELMRAFIDAQ